MRENDSIQKEEPQRPPVFQPHEAGQVILVTVHSFKGSHFIDADTKAWGSII